ncbi:hypothetical protein GCM10022226_08400 [Sphaerisporangium flaviroseum]|uniref:Uncharacterized protein n=1 Tax=Sphaerisporangium flaviroseum TaxID=509199 RepID=A0ABP7HLC6_9ACTN
MCSTAGYAGGAAPGTATGRGDRPTVVRARLRGVSDTAAIGGITAVMSLATAIGAALFAAAARCGAKVLLVGEFAAPASGPP